MNKRVIVRDWRDEALEREAVGCNGRVCYITFCSGHDEAPAGEPVGFPLETVFPFREGIAGRSLTDAEWSKLTPMEWSSEGR